MKGAGVQQARAGVLGNKMSQGSRAEGRLRIATVLSPAMLPSAPCTNSFRCEALAPGTTEQCGAASQKT
jgi:hypothetical protein